MNKWKSGTFLLILVVGLTTAETVTNSQDPAGNPPKQSLQGDSGKVDYETALRPAVLQKRSIANIARLLLGGGNAPSNHPLVKYPEPKTWNLASNIVAALPAASASLAAAASSQGDSWNRRPSAIESVQQIFETKAKLIPYTGQVATGLTGLASVKGDLLRQIHSISTQAIAQTAAEAAARALAGAAAAHAVTNSLAHTVNPGADTGIKGGWSSYQNLYSNGLGRPPIDQPGPPYQSLSSAHINHYQTPSQYNSNPYAISATNPPPQLPPSLPSPVSYQPAAQSQYQNQNQNQNNGYYTLYNTQPASTAHVQNPYTPAPPLAYARPTFSPTLIATPPSVPAGNFGRSFAQPSPASSVLSTISSLLSASTAAYNAAFPGGIPAQQSSSLYSSLPTAASPNPSSSVFRQHAGPIAAPSDVRTGIRSPGHYNRAVHRPAVNSLSQGSGNYGSSGGSLSSNSLRHNSAVSNPGYAPQASPPLFNSPSYSLNQHATSHDGQNYAQSGANPYSAQSVQTSQFGGIGSAPGNPGVGSGGNYATVGNGVGSGYQGYNGGAGHSPGFAGRWDSQHAGSASGAPAASWPGTQNHYTPQGYAGQAAGNTNNPSGGFGGAATQFPVAASPTFAQQTYSAAAANAYQSSAANGYAQAQQPASPPYFGTAPLNTGYQRSSNANSVGGGRNSNLNYQYDSQDLYQSASTMGRGNDDDNNYHQAQRRNRRPSSNSNSNSRTRYPSSLKKRPSSKRPQNSYKSEGGSVNAFGGSGNVRKGESGKRVIPTGNKKGSEFDSSVDVDVDDEHDEYYNDGEQYNYSEEYRNHKTDPDDNENRWRSKNPSGQRPNSFHNNNPNGRWHGEVGPSKQTRTKNVRGHVKGSERARPQFAGGKGSGNIRNKKIPPRDKQQHEKRQKQKPEQSSKSVSSQPKRERQPVYLSRDVYTTLPEYVFRVDERPDVFLRPIGRWKYRGKVGGKGFIKPRIGEADGPGGDKFGENSEFDEDLEARYDSSRFLIEPAPRRRAEEILDSSNRGVDGSSRMDDILNDSQFPISVELDPEEREASVDEVYADYNHRRHDYNDSVEDDKEIGEEEK